MNVRRTKAFIDATAFEATFHLWRAFLEALCTCPPDENADATFDASAARFQRPMVTKTTRWRTSMTAIWS